MSKYQVLKIDHHGVEDSNPSNNPHLQDLIEARLSRRDLLKGGVGAVAMSVFGGALMTHAPSARAAGLALGFAAIDKNLNDRVTVPEGYTVRRLISKGDPLAPGVSAYLNNGTQTDFLQRNGDEHDALYYFGMDASGNADPGNNDRGLLVMNHEVVRPEQLFVNGARIRKDGTRPNGQVRAEMQNHGVSVVEVAKNASGDFRVVVNSPFNRRIHGYSRMRLAGPLRGNAQAVTRFSPEGTFTRGTLNNCANGYTPWGTYLTCEENWAGYFTRAAGSDALITAKQAQSHSRYGVPIGENSRYAWELGSLDFMKRMDISPTGANASQDYRNEASTYGWVVEIDPFDPASTPVKRSTMGRFAHEGAWLGGVEAGKPLVFYTGDDSRGEYMYKFVSTARWNPADAGGGIAAGNKYLNRGKLYVARFNASGSGRWLELSHGVNGLNRSNPVYPFADQADVLINARLAADAVGATRMDRPEWAAVNPVNNEVYLTLTNNTNRRVVPSSSSQIAVDAANPRDFNDPDADIAPNEPGSGNRNGHIIRWRERNDQSFTLSFTWDIYLFASQANGDPAKVNLSNLSEDNDFSSPDGLWFARESSPASGLLWIQTDDGAYADVTNNQMLAACPGQVGDGAAVTLNGVTTFRGTQATDATVRRFLVGPLGCEVTGVDTTPDGKVMFVNIQHPGEDGDPTDPQSAWPSNQFGGPGVRPRSSTVVITRNDDGVIGIA